MTRPHVLNSPLDLTRTPVLISSPFEHLPNYLKEDPRTQGSPPDPTRGLNALAYPNGRLATRGTSKRRHLLISPGPVALPYPPGDGKTPWFTIVPSEAPNGEAAPLCGIAVG